MRPTAEWLCLLSKISNQSSEVWWSRCSFEFWGRCSAGNSSISFRDINLPVFELWFDSGKKDKSNSESNNSRDVQQKRLVCPDGKHSFNKQILFSSMAQRIWKAIVREKEERHGDLLKWLIPLRIEEYCFYLNSVSLVSSLEEKVIILKFLPWEPPLAEAIVFESSLLVSLGALSWGVSLGCLSLGLLLSLTADDVICIVYVTGSVLEIK